jgi:hypothetical protein
VIEASTDSEWVARCLEALGLHLFAEIRYAARNMPSQVGRLGDRIQSTFQ